MSRISTTLGVFIAIWLLLEEKNAWLLSRTEQWWADQAEYILRQLHPGMVGEDSETKLSILQALRSKAGGAFRSSIVRLVESDESDAASVLREAFSSSAEDPDEELVLDLIRSLECQRIPARICRTVTMLLHQAAPTASVATCEKLLDQTREGFDASTAFEVGVAFAAVDPERGWGPLVELLKQQQPGELNLLNRFARAMMWQDDDDDTPSLSTLPSDLLREVFVHYFDLYHPVFAEESKDEEENAGELVNAERMDNFLHRLMNETSGRGDAESVRAFRDLESRYGKKYQWLRRPRAKAERNHRMANWQPHQLEAITRVLNSADKRLILDEADVLDGIQAALEAYEGRLHHHSPSELEDLWDTPRDREPTPKSEERVSDKICAAIRDYFHKYAVTANREVQIRRRVRDGDAGAPGSRLDVLVDVPRAGAVGRAPIAVPVEVKLSHNQEAKTAMKTQLVERYMDELGTSCGCYVVVWMDEPGGSRKPRWGSMDQARAILSKQAADLDGGSDGERHLRAIVIDGSLPRPKR